MNTEEYQTRYGTDPDYIDENGEVYDTDELADLYDDMLDDYGTVTIDGNAYIPSEILKAVDPIAYRVGMSDYVSALDWDEWSKDHEWIEDEDEDED